MGTRATYRVIAKNDYSPTLTFYIHWDGYKEGAASYFYNMIEAATTYHGEKYPRIANGGFPTAFIRGNNLAEFTKSHELHGDTEFRYDLDGHTLKVWTRRGWDSPSWDRETFDLAEFINKYHNEDKKVYKVPNEYGKGFTLYTIDTLAAEIRKEESTLAIWEKNGHGEGANAESLRKRISKLIDIATERQQSS